LNPAWITKTKENSSERFLSSEFFYFGFVELAHGEG